MSIQRYDPEVAPDPQDWKELDEQLAMELIAKFHRRHDDDHVQGGSPRMHAVIHTIVENQVAMGDELQVAATLQRLVAEGLSRHDAIHAIGSVVATDIYNILKHEEPLDEDQRRTKGEAKLAALSAATWLAGFDGEDPQTNQVATEDRDDTCGDASCGHDHHDVRAPVRAEPKIGRNEPCPCGSGAKYKKCCGK